MVLLAPTAMDLASRDGVRHDSGLASTCRFGECEDLCWRGRHNAASTVTTVHYNSSAPQRGRTLRGSLHACSQRFGFARRGEPCQGGGSSMAGWATRAPTWGRVPTRWSEPAGQQGRRPEDRAGQLVPERSRQARVVNTSDVRSVLAPGVLVAWLVPPPHMHGAHCTLELRSGYSCVCQLGSLQALTSCSGAVPSPTSCMMEEGKFQLLFQLHQG